jgi:hypothetical protein
MRSSPDFGSVQTCFLRLLQRPNRYIAPCRRSIPSFASVYTSSSDPVLSIYRELADVTSKHHFGPTFSNLSGHFSWRCIRRDFSLRYDRNLSSMTFSLSSDLNDDVALFLRRALSISSNSSSGNSSGQSRDRVE